MRREWKEGVEEGEEEGEGGGMREGRSEKRMEGRSEGKGGRGGKEGGGNSREERKRRRGRSGIQYVKCSRLIPRPLPGLGRKFGNKGRKQQVEEPTYVPDRPSLIPSH